MHRARGENVGQWTLLLHIHTFKPQSESESEPSYSFDDVPLATLLSCLPALQEFVVPHVACGHPEIVALVNASQATMRCLSFTLGPSSNMMWENTSGLSFDLVSELLHLQRLEVTCDKVDKDMPHRGLQLPELTHLVWNCSPDCTDFLAKSRLPRLRYLRLGSSFAINNSQEVGLRSFFVGMPSYELELDAVPARYISRIIRFAVHATKVTLNYADNSEGVPVLPSQMSFFDHLPPTCVSLELPFNNGVHRIMSAILSRVSGGSRKLPRHLSPSLKQIRFTRGFSWARAETPLGWRTDESYDLACGKVLRYTSSLAPLGIRVLDQDGVGLAHQLFHRGV
jgi:hypothetical protein